MDERWTSAFSKESDEEVDSMPESAADQPKDAQAPGPPGSEGK
jgi:hypothetical protein